MYSGSVVKDQGHSEAKCTFPTEGYPSTYGRPYRCVNAAGYTRHGASRITCFSSTTRYDRMCKMKIFNVCYKWHVANRTASMINRQK